MDKKIDREFNRLKNDKKRISNELNNEKKKFINKMLKNKVAIKSNGGKYKYKRTPWILSFFKKNIVKFYRFVKFYVNKLYFKIFKNR